MTRVHVYVDESGNFDFSRNSGATRYFILTTVTFFDDRQACVDLDRLKYDLAWEQPEAPFHAAEDRQSIRDRVFSAIDPHRFRVDATILDKPKAKPTIRQTNTVFYQYAWYYHMRHVIHNISHQGDEVLIIASSLGTKRKKDDFHSVIVDVMNQLTFGRTIRTTHWPSATDAGLQIADYCSWAIFRKWERNDKRSHGLISRRIRSEYDLFKSGKISYY